MSFRNTKTPLKPTTPAKWQIPTRHKYKAGKDEYYLEGELKERFCKLFPKNSNRRMMTWFGISFSTLQRFKREFSLEKDMQAIRKQHAKDIKKICEKNGYYASIRGKAPSEACMEATRQLRAAGFHPMKQLKANNPRKYKRLMRKKSEQRKELWRKERLRAFYGLERQTNLRIPSSPLSHKATAQKHAMIKCCNYFADPDGDPHIICYDSETQRSARREATAAKHGLKVVEADEYMNLNKTMKLRIIPMNAYDYCIPVTVYMVQKYVGGCIFGKWINIKGFSDYKKAVALMSLLEH